MSKFTVRFREVFIYEMEIESASYREALNHFQKKIDKVSTSHEAKTVGLRYEVESVTQGEIYEIPRVQRQPDPKKWTSAD